MEITFIKLNESHDAIQFEYASPEERQRYRRAITPSIPEGYAYCVTEGKSAMKRPTDTLSLVKIGEKPVVGSPDKRTVVDAPQPLTVPDVVTKASDAELEVMAAKAGLVVNESWSKRNRPMREGAVARALAKANAR